MAIKDLIDEINSDVNDVIQTGFEYAITNLVPNRSDGQLTFERNITKKGKTLTSCVLYVDIRNSVDLTQKHHGQTMGRIYTAFSKAVLKAAKYHNGHIRNIIGDRVMIVFPSKDCFINAVDCAITINHVAKNVINNAFKNVDFKCGIGIDYGSLNIIKVGIQRKGNEGTENRSLVWVGYPANIASRLTDVANKTMEQPFFEIFRHPLNPSAIKEPFNVLSILGISNYDPAASTYLTTVEKVELSPEEFADSISSVKNGELFMLGGKFISFSKKSRTIRHHDILLTEAVFNGLKAANPNRTDLINNFWKEQSHPVKNVKGKIYGGDITWKI